MRENRLDAEVYRLTENNDLHRHRVEFVNMSSRVRDCESRAKNLTFHTLNFISHSSRIEPVLFDSNGCRTQQLLASLFATSKPRPRQTPKPSDLQYSRDSLQ